ncbi:MAG: acyl-ACP--UDP-N-acetylglucosamine O-acyltransferase [Planctomycetaceae bacterium]|jgi:UDP-N-acetylglucosamine acyltransferase|nr:acyl-ACP--UDP-N-acetylglucosamine O-acyltransferase [Planctomycetaceae bacterium]
MMKDKDVQIHPLSSVSPKAKIGHGVNIGPFCVVEKGVEIGDGTVLEARVSIKEGTIVGENNHFCEGSVIGGLPQHVAVPEECGMLIIGSENMFRENVTIHRALKESNATILGDNNLLMVNAHIAHDCRLGDNIIMANNVMIAGHVTIGNKANISGAVGVHQFCRIGEYAMVGGQSHISQDVPPFVTVDGLTSNIVGLNMIGLRRGGFAAEDVKQLKEAYHIVFRSELPWRDILKTLEERYTKGAAMELTRFLTSTTRGILREGRRHPNALSQLKLRRATEDGEDEVTTIRLNVG